MNKYKIKYSEVIQIIDHEIQVLLCECQITGDFIVVALENNVIIAQSFTASPQNLSDASSFLCTIELNFIDSLMCGLEKFFFTSGASSSSPFVSG